MFRFLFLLNLQSSKFAFWPSVVACTYKCSYLKGKFRIGAGSILVGGNSFLKMVGGLCDHMQSVTRTGTLLNTRTWAGTCGVTYKFAAIRKAQ